MLQNTSKISSLKQSHVFGSHVSGSTTWAGLGRQPLLCFNVLVQRSEVLMKWVVREGFMEELTLQLSLKDAVGLVR